MAIRLIINADDYGRSAGISRGIRDAHRHGIVTSTTALMNMPTVEDDLEIALRDTPRLGLGVHLVLTAGKPLLPVERVRSLVDETGKFFDLKTLTGRHGSLDATEAKDEWRAQIEKFIAITDRTPTHLDSHHHASYFSEDLFRSMLELAAEYGCAIRPAAAQIGNETLAGLPSELESSIREFFPRLVAEFKPRSPIAFIPEFYDELATKSHLLTIIAGLPGGTFEIMCHPGYADAELIQSTIYARQREKELRVLMDPEVKNAIERTQIELISFARV